MASLASGLPKSYIKKYGISKKAWREYRKSKGRSSRTRRVSPSPRRTGVRRLTRRYRRKRRRRSPRTIPILPIGGALVGATVPSEWSGGNTVISRLMEGNFVDAAKIAQAHYLGIDPYDGKFKIELAAHGWVPIIVGGIMHKAANMLGINRHMSRLPSPLNKLRL